jgi:hypothetical protein
LVLALNANGQISIEFIMIITIAFVYIGASIWPIATDSAQSALDVKAVADTKLAATKIAGALNEAASSGGDMKETISISLPQDSEVRCDGTESLVRFEVRVTNSGGNPDEINCTDGPLSPDESPAYYTCSSALPLVSGASTPFSITGPIFKEAVVEKELGAITVS